VPLTYTSVMQLGARAAIVFTLGATACQRVGPPPCPSNALPLPRSADLGATVVDAKTVERYFTVANRTDGEVALNYYSGEWFAAKLLELGESSLLERRVDRDLHAYRILFMPSLNAFGDSVLRIEGDRTTFVERKRTELCEDARFEGAAIVTRRAAVATRDWERLVGCMNAFFWTARAESSPGGEDGWTTVIEGVRGGTHHAVHRWCLECGDFDLNASDSGLLECVQIARATLHASTPEL